MQYSQDIPRICTALAEWGACTAYLYLIKKEQFRRPSFWCISLTVLAVQTAFLQITGGLPVAFWLSCMTVAVAVMYVFLLMGGGLSLLGGWLLLCKGISFGGVCSLFGMAGICVFTVHGIWESVDSGDFSYCCIWGLFLDRG